MTTPIRSLLALASPLIPSVLPGLKALSSTEYIDESIRVRFSDSLDLDKALQSQFPEDPRWDYLLGLGNPSVVVGLEAHTAHTDQVSVVIAKRAAAIRQLRGHLRKGRSVGLGCGLPRAGSTSTRTKKPDVDLKRTESCSLASVSWRSI